MIFSGPTPEITGEALRNRDASFERRYSTWPGNAHAEPLSSAFVEAANFRIEVKKPRNKYQMRVLTYVTVRYHPWAAPVVRRIAATGHQRQHTGAPYPELALKRLANQWDTKGYLTILQAGLELFRTPMFEETGRQQYRELMRTFKGFVGLNNVAITKDPTLVIGGRPPDTGTGWEYPFDTRGNAAANWHNAGHIVEGALQYYDDFEQAFELWPGLGSIIQCPMRWKGILGGCRSDVDYVSQSYDQSVLEATAREVTNDPSSIFFTPALMTPQRRRELWSTFSSPYSKMPWDIEALMLIKGTPPVTADFLEAGDTAVLSADFGFAQNTGHFAGARLQPPASEGTKAGADQLALLGIVNRTSRNDYLLHYVSGAPSTMIGYNALAGSVYAYVIRKLNLKVWYLQVGDDVHFYGRIEELKLLYEQLAPWLRVKGMQGNENFILGEYSRFRDREHVSLFVDPRPFRSETSAQQTQGLPTIYPGKTYNFPADYKNPETHAAAIEASREAWSLYPEIFFWDGKVDELPSTYGSIYRSAKQLLISLGFSEWAAGWLYD